MKDLNRREMQSLLPRRLPRDNKAMAGKSLVLAGHEGFWGAAILAGTAAARVGSGYVTLFSDFKKSPFPSLQHPDFLTVDSKKKKISEIAFSAAAIGPGLGVTGKTAKLLQELLRLKVENVVVDADALTVTSQKSLGPFPASWILTPHEGELSRLLKISAEKIRADRKWAVLQATKKWGCIVVLKGHQTLIASGKKVFRCRTGNPALAKAGTGDVLTGMITGFLAQGLEPLNAAKLGVFVHGLLADEWIEKKDPLSLMASDLLDLLPGGLKKLRGRTRRKKSAL